MVRDRHGMWRIRHFGKCPLQRSYNYVNGFGLGERVTNLGLRQVPRDHAAHDVPYLLGPWFRLRRESPIKI